MLTSLPQSELKIHVLRPSVRSELRALQFMEAEEAGVGEGELSNMKHVANDLQLDTSVVLSSIQGLEAIGQLVE